MKNSFTTSVNIRSDLYEDFKKANTAIDKLSLQDLVNRSMYLCNTDPEFRKKIRDFVLPIIQNSDSNSGSHPEFKLF